VLLLWLACAPHPTDSAEPATAQTLVVPLRWVGGSPLLDWPQAQAGLWWSLSSLGALPPDATALVVDSLADGAVTFSLDLGAVGFPAEAAGTLAEIAAEMQSDPSVARHGGVDVGRFLMRTLHEPWRYYALTGACATAAQWQATRQQPDPAVYAVTDSLLVEGSRLIEVNDQAGAVGAIGFRSAEVSGTLGAHTVEELEVVDVMPNGRQRFAVYSASGALQPASDPALSPAGQPGRCLWCHESRLMLGQPNPDIEGYWSYESFAEAIAAQSALLEAHRASLETVVDFTEPSVHTWGELLVEEFLFPTPARVALEWGISEGAVRAAGLDGTESEEYPAWGTVYARAAVDGALWAREGWRPVETLASSRAAPESVRLAPADLRDCGTVR